jgi:hypothetical protein
VRVTRLLDEIAAWRRAQDVRGYIAALRSNRDDLGPQDRERISGWCDWADEWERRTDPTQSTSLVRGLLVQELPRWASAATGWRQHTSEMSVAIRVLGLR